MGVPIVIALIRVKNATIWWWKNIQRLNMRSHNTSCQWCLSQNGVPFEKVVKQLFMVLVDGSEIWLTS